MIQKVYCNGEIIPNFGFASISKSNRNRPFIGRANRAGRNFGEEIEHTSGWKQMALLGCGQTVASQSSGTREEEESLTQV